jgi:hypothetical protein
MYLVKPSDVSRAVGGGEAAIASAPPIGSEGMLKTRLGELDHSMQKILVSSMPQHEKIRLYLEALRQYIMGARHLDRVLQQQQQQDTPSLRFIDREMQTDEQVAKRLHETSTSTDEVRSERAAQTDEPMPKRFRDVETSTDAEIVAAPLVSTPSADERPIRPSRQSFYEIAEQAPQPFNMNALLDQMPPSRKPDAKKFLMEIANSTTMRWDPATGHVYRGSHQISGVNSLINKFLQKRFSTNQAAKAELSGYDDFLSAASEARASQRPMQVKQQVGEGSRAVWLRY